MTSTLSAQLGAALLAAATPWIVVRLALTTAARHAPPGAPPLRTPAPARRLAQGTALLLAALCAAALLLPERSAWLPAAGAAAFLALAGVALLALHEIDETTRATREVASSTRTARLERRRVRHHLPWAWRVVPWALLAAGGTAFLWRLATPLADRRLLAPLAFAAAAAIFLGLYEAWIHDVVTGPSATVGEAVSAEAERGGRVRRLHALEVTLVAGFLSAAHGLLDLDWAADGPWGATVVLAAGLLGVVGCGLAISSRLALRGYPLADPRR